MIMIIIFLYICIVATTTVSAQQQFNPPQEWYFYSGSQQVWYHNNLVWEKYLGKASVEFDKNFTYESQYRICSNSKLFVSVALMQLMEAGHFSSIHDPISKYLNQNDLLAWGFPPSTHKYCPTIYGQSSSACQNVTFVSLMSMASGIVSGITCDYSPSQWQYQYCLPNVDVTYYNGSIALLISQFIRSPLQWAPGPTYNLNATGTSPPNGPTGTYQYANENYIVLSYFVQKFSGMSLQAYVKANIMNRVGMSSGSYFDPWDQAFAIQPNANSEYVYYTDVTKSYEPFAYGNCYDIEANPGQESGSGGFTATIPDMVKWYSSLFITKNASLVSASSLAQIIYPWSWTGYPFYYGLGIEITFATTYNVPPRTVTQSPTSISYMGGSMCQFLAMTLYNWTYNIEDGQNNLISLPIISAVGRNNRILNMTQRTWQNMQLQRNGSWIQLVDFPTGYGGANSDFTDTQSLGLALATYFAGFPASELVPVTAPVVVPAPTAAPLSCSNDVTGYVVAVALAATLVPTLIIICCLSVWICFLLSQKKEPMSQQSETSTTTVVEMEMNTGRKL